MYKRRGERKENKRKREKLGWARFMKREGKMLRECSKDFLQEIEEENLRVYFLVSPEGGKCVVSVKRSDLII